MHYLEGDCSGIILFMVYVTVCFVFIYRSSRKRSLVNGFVYGLSNSIMFFAYAGAFTYGSYLVQTGELEFHLVFR